MPVVSIRTTVAIGQDPATTLHRIEHQGHAADDRTPACLFNAERWMGNETAAD